MDRIESSSEKEPQSYFPEGQEQQSQKLAIGKDQSMHSLENPYQMESQIMNKQNRPGQFLPSFQNEDQPVLRETSRDERSTPTIQVDSLFVNEARTLNHSFLRQRTQDFQAMSHNEIEKSMHQISEGNSKRPGKTQSFRGKDKGQREIKNEINVRTAANNNAQIEDIRFVTEEFSRNFSNSFRIDDTDLQRNLNLASLNDQKSGKNHLHSEFTPNGERLGVSPRPVTHFNHNLEPVPEQQLSPRFLRKMLIDCDQQRRQFDQKWQSMMGYMLQAYDEQEQLIHHLRQASTPQVANQDHYREQLVNQRKGGVKTSIYKAQRRVSVPMPSMEQQRVTILHEHHPIFTTQDNFEQMQQLFELNTERSKLQHDQSHLAQQPSRNLSQMPSRLPSMRRATLQNTINSRNNRKDESQNQSSSSNPRVQGTAEGRKTIQNQTTIKHTQRYHDRSNSLIGKGTQLHASHFSKIQEQPVDSAHSPFNLEEFVSHLRSQLAVCKQIIRKDKQDKIKLVERLRSLAKECTELRQRGREGTQQQRISELKEQFAAQHKSQRSSLKSAKNLSFQLPVDDPMLFKKISELVEENILSERANSAPKDQHSQSNSQNGQTDQQDDQQQRDSDQNQSQQKAPQVLSSNKSLRSIAKQSPLSSHGRIHSFSKHIQHSHSTSKFALDPHSHSASNFKIQMHDDFEESRLRENVVFWKEKVDILLQEKKEALQEQMSQHKLIRDYESQIEELKAKMRHKEQVIESFQIEQKVQSTRMNGLLSTGGQFNFEGTGDRDSESHQVQQDQFKSQRSQHRKYSQIGILKGQEEVEPEFREDTHNDVNLLSTPVEADFALLQPNYLQTTQKSRNLAVEEFEENAKYEGIDSLIQGQDLEGLKLYHKFIDEKAMALLHQRESVLSEVRQESLGAKHTINMLTRDSDGQHRASINGLNNMGTLQPRQEQRIESAEYPLVSEINRFLTKGQEEQRPKQVRLTKNGSYQSQASPSKNLRGSSGSQKQNHSIKSGLKQNNQKSQLLQYSQQPSILQPNFMTLGSMLDPQQLRPVRQPSQQQSYSNTSLLNHKRQMSNTLAPVLGSARDLTSSLKKKQDDMDKSTSRSPKPKQGMPAIGFTRATQSQLIEEEAFESERQQRNSSLNNQESTPSKHKVESQTSRQQQEQRESYSLPSSQNTMKSQQELSKDQSPSQSQKQKLEQKSSQNQKAISKAKVSISKTRAASNSNKKIKANAKQPQQMGSSTSKIQAPLRQKIQKRGQDGSSQGRGVGQTSSHGLHGPVQVIENDKSMNLIDKIIETISSQNNKQLDKSHSYQLMMERASLESLQDGQQQRSQMHQSTDSNADNMMTYDRSQVSSSATFRLQKAPFDSQKQEQGKSVSSQGRLYQSPMSHAKSILNAYKLQQQPLSRSKAPVPQDLAANIQRTLQQQHSQQWQQQQQQRQLINQYLEFERLNASGTLNKRSLEYLNESHQLQMHEYGKGPQFKTSILDAPKHNYRSSVNENEEQKAHQNDSSYYQGLQNSSLFQTQDFLSTANYLKDDRIYEELSASHSSNHKSKFQNYQENKNKHESNQFNKNNSAYLKMQSLENMNDSLSPGFNDYLYRPSEVNADVMASAVSQGDQRDYREKPPQKQKIRPKGTKQQSAEKLKHAPSEGRVDIKKEIKNLNRLRAQADGLPEETLNSTLYSGGELNCSRGGLYSYSKTTSSHPPLATRSQPSKQAINNKFYPSKDANQSSNLAEQNESIYSQKIEELARGNSSSSVAARQLKRNFQRLMNEGEQAEQSSDQSDRAFKQETQNYGSRGYQEKRIKDYISQNVHDSYYPEKQDDFHSTLREQQQLFQDYLAKDMSEVSSPIPRGIERVVSYPQHQSSGFGGFVERASAVEGAATPKQQLDLKSTSSAFSPNSGAISRSYEPSQLGHQPHTYMQPPQQQFNVSGNAQIIFNHSIDNSHSSMSIASPHANLLLTGASSSLSLYPIMPQSVQSNTAVNLQLLNGSSSTQVPSLNPTMPSGTSKMFENSLSQQQRTAVSQTNSQSNFKSLDLHTLGARHQHLQNQQQQPYQPSSSNNFARELLSSVNSRQLGVGSASLQERTAVSGFRHQQLSKGQR